MKYMGSKARHAKDLIPIILKDHKAENWYVEPFVGGANMLDKVESSVAPKRFAADVHPYLISMWQAVSNGWMPPNNFTEEEYKSIRKNPERFAPELVGYVGFALSYGGKWFGGWRRDGKGLRNYVQEAYSNAQKQFPKLHGVKFANKSVFDLKINEHKELTIYCDPPYRGTTNYGNSFDHDRFYDWCRLAAEKGHHVFISEYEMPKDFKVLWEKEVTSSLTKDTGSKMAVEKLFTL